MTDRNIYNKNGGIRLANGLTSLEYNGAWMGACYLTTDIKSAIPVDFAFGDYILYRGEKFVLDYQPTVLKKARRNTTGDGFVYDNIRFYSLGNELTQIRFRDIVLNDNHVHYTSLPEFSFYAEDIDDMADRLQANTDKWCAENGIASAWRWKFITPSRTRSYARGVTVAEYTDAYGADATYYTEGEKFNVNVDVSNASVWDSLANIKDKFGLNFIIRSRHCIVGPAGVPTNHLFKYGKDNGLYEIERTADSEQSVVTRLTAYGSSENMPLRYYATIEDGLMPNNMAVNCLMLPGFPKYALSSLCRSLYDALSDKTVFELRKTPQDEYKTFMTVDGRHLVDFSDDREDPYLLSENHTSVGIKDGSISFVEDTDDNGLKKIYPSIEGMTVGDVEGTSDPERLDEILSCDIITDSGVFGEGDTEPGNFTITLKDLGFDLREAFEQGGSQMVIAMKDGYCGGREFHVTAVHQNNNDTWACTCERERDDLLDLYFPYSYSASTGGTPTADEPYQIRTGDHFVLTGICMTDTSYIWAASVRLLRGSIAWLLANCYTRYTYMPRVDEIFMARQHDTAVATNNRSLYMTLKEGDVMLFEDTDLGISGSVFIDTLRIKEYGNGMIPTYDVTLRNDKQVGTLQRMQNQISSLTSFVNHGGGGFTAAQIREFVASYGADYFLSKLSPDTAQGLITFLQGIAFGDGATGIDGNGDAALRDVNGRDALFERLTAQEAHFFNLIIDEVKSVGGQLVITDANCTAEKVVPVAGEDNLLRVYFQAADGTRATVNQWAEDDQALHYEFDVESGETRNYWIRVAGASSEPVAMTIDGVEGVACHWIDLDMSDKKAGSSVPQAGDDIAQLGNRTDADRQNAIIISAYNIPFIDSAPYLGQVQGIKAPLFASYQGINSFDIAQSNRVNVIAGNGNLFRGQVTIESGSTLADGRPVNDLGTEEGNLLRNTDFCGDYESEAATADTEMTADTPLWSAPLKHWEHANAAAADYAAAGSGRCVSLTGGYLSQDVALETGAWYMLSLYANGSDLTVTADGRTYEQTLSGVRTRIDIPLRSTGAGGVRFDGTCILSDIILTRGTLPVEWQRSALDAPVSKKTDMANDYLRKAINEASTSILGGLVLSSMMKVGMWRRNTQTGDWQMNEETGGMSGVRNDDKSPFLWGGGDLQKAIETIDKYVEDPSYQATDEEIAGMAQFVVTHGGRAILNDVILRGYIYALGGRFRGTVEALGGLFKNISTPNGNFSIDENGNMSCKGADVEGTVRAASGYFSGADGMYEIKFDADARELTLWGPDRVAGLNDYTPAADAQKVLYLRIGGIFVTGQDSDGACPVAPYIVLYRRHRVTLDDMPHTFIDSVSIDPYEGLLFKRQDNYAGHIGEEKTVAIFGDGTIYVDGETPVNVILKNLPTSDTYLNVGGVWNDNGTLRVKTS